MYCNFFDYPLLKYCPIQAVDYRLLNFFFIQAVHLARTASCHYTTEEGALSGPEAVFPGFGTAFLGSGTNVRDTTLFELLKSMKCEEIAFFFM